MILGQPEKMLSAKEEYRLILPQIMDISEQEGIKLELELLTDELCELEIILYPLHIARPEFFPSVKGHIALKGKGFHKAELPFEQFEFRQMVRAFLTYLDGISVRLVSGGPVLLKGIKAGCMGDFSVYVKGSSKTGESNDTVSYTVSLSNTSCRQRLVNVRQSMYGKECLPAEYEPFAALEAYETKDYVIKIKITEDIPAGGLEKSNFLFVPDGDGTQAKKVTLYTSKAKKHPYLFLKEEQWEKRKAAILKDEKLQQVYLKQYQEPAENWRVPEISKQESFVYPSYSQNGLFQTAVAWKLSGNDIYLQKVLQYLTGLLDEKDGYLATRQSYFVFIENKEEYARGDFKVHRAVNAGWVQEAEFFNKVAMTYDLLYGYFTKEQHECMEKCLRNYMKFAGWRLTDGDGNNFQLAEATAGLLCAMVLQDYEMTERFLYGYNGYMDLLSAVFLDDGMYFEEATGYMKLAGEIYFDAVNAAENFGIALKHARVPASFDRNILHSPWSMREEWAEDGKPFLGMSFRRFEQFTNPHRTLKDYFDCTAKLLNDRGILFSINDSNEQDFTELYKKAYFLYEEPLYKKIADLSDKPELLLVPEEAEKYELGKQSVLLPGAGMGILRDGSSQAVLKFGTHGGYHGHYDRLSLASFIKENRTFHNNEFAWFGYDSFLFKMWVQTSVAHNMVVVDGRMQKPSPCDCIYYADEEEFSAVCAQTETEWMDPPYGGQTPYPLIFPEEKCKKEGRFILAPEQRRAQGEIGDYSEPVLQRRLLVLFHGYCIVWDYLEGKEEHRYDCLYHPMGKFKNEVKVKFNYRKRFSEEPFGAGQFILNCYTTSLSGTVNLKFHEAAEKVNGNDIIANLPETSIWRAYPQSGEVTIGKYPYRADTFTEENIKSTLNYFEDPLKKTVSFSSKGKQAKFITLLEAGQSTGRIKEVQCDGFNTVTIEEVSGEKWKIAVMGMEKRSEKITVEVSRS